MGVVGKQTALGEVDQESIEEIDEVGEYTLLERFEMGVVGGVDVTD